MLYKAVDKTNGVFVGIGTKEDLDQVLVHYLAETAGTRDDILLTEPTADEINAEIAAGGLIRAM